LYYSIGALQSSESEIIYDKNAIKEFNQFDMIVQKDFVSYIKTLEQEGELKFPEARKITKDIFEIRVHQDGSYSGFYAYIKHPDIVILHFFQKKSQKTPIKNIKTAIHRLRYYR